MTSKVIPHEKRLGEDLMYPSSEEDRKKRRRHLMAAVVALTVVLIVGVAVIIIVLTSDDNTEEPIQLVEETSSGSGSAPASAATTRRTTTTTTTRAARISTTTARSAEEAAPAGPANDCQSVKTTASGKPCVLPYSIRFPPAVAGIFPGLDVDKCDTLGNVVPPQAAAAKGIVFPGTPDDQYICVVGEAIRAVPIAGETTVPIVEPCAAPCNT